MRGLLQSTIGATIRIETVLGSDRWLALGDASQVELMILKLVINSRDAMALGGAITIETANVALKAPHRPEEPPAGDYVMLPTPILASAFRRISSSACSSRSSRRRKPC